MKMNENIIISVDINPEHKEDSVLLVGRPKGWKTEIVNIFQGEAATELYRKLTTVERMQMAAR